MKKRVFIITGIVLIVITSALGFISRGFTSWNTSEWGNSITDLFTSETSEDGSDSTSDSDSILDTTTLTQGMTIKQLSTGVDTNGHATTTFSYTITPATSSNPFVTVTTTFADGTSCDAFLTAFHYDDLKTIKLTNLAPFSQVINVKVASLAYPNVYGTVTVNYVKRLTGYSMVETTTDADSNEEDTYDSTFLNYNSEGIGNYAVTKTFSIGTKEPVLDLYFADSTSNISAEMSDDIVYYMGQDDTFIQHLNAFCESVFINIDEQYLASTWTNLNGDSYFASLDESKQILWNEFLFDKMSGGNSGYSFLFSGKIKDNNHTYVNIDFQTYIDFEKTYDFSPYYTALSAINPEIGNIDF